MSLYESFDFFGGGIGVAKIAFSLERLSYGQIFLTKFGGTFFFRCLFFLGQRENCTGKKLAEIQSMKIQVKSGEISQERWKKEVKRRESQTYT